MRAVESVLLALTGLLLLIGTVASRSEPHAVVTDTAVALDDLRYTSASGEGSFGAECSNPYASLKNGVPDALRLAAGAARLTVYQYNVTRVVDGSPQPPAAEVFDDETSAPRPVQTVDLPPGASLSISQAGHAYLAQDLAMDPPEPPAQAATSPTHARGATAVFETHMWRTEAGSVSAGPPYRAVKVGEHALTAPTGNGGRLGYPRIPAIKTILDGPIRMRGDAYALVDEASFDAADFHLALPPFRQSTMELGTQGVALQRLIETYAVLDLRGASWSFVPQSSLDCEDLRWSGDGHIALHGATGTIRAGPVRRHLSNETFDWTGRADLNEKAFAKNPTERLSRSGSQIRAGHAQLRSSQATAVRVDPVPAWTWSIGLALWAAWVLARSWPAAGSFLFTRLRPDRILRQPVRAALHAAISDQPGIHTLDLARLLGRSYGTVRHHVRVLKNAGLLRCVRHGNTVHLYVPNANMRELEVVAALRRDPSLRVLLGLLAADGSTPRAAAKGLRGRLGLSRAGAWKVVRRARRLRLVDVLERDGCVILRPRGRPGPSGTA